MKSINFGLNPNFQENWITIFSGELARSYPQEELPSKFSTMGMAFGLGFIVGPGINFAFLKMDFQLIGVRVW